MNINALKGLHPNMRAGIAEIIEQVAIRVWRDLDRYPDRQAETLKTLQEELNAFKRGEIPLSWQEALG